MKKKKILRICVVCLLLLITVTVGCIWMLEKSKMSRLYEEYRYPNEEFYGKELYSEIDHKCSDHESEVGNVIVNKGLEVLQYTGTESDAETEMGDVGALSRYYRFQTSNTVSQEGTFQFITCKLSGDEGHVWVACTCKGYDENGNQVAGFSDVLSLWYIENREGEWYVVRVQEAP